MTIGSEGQVINPSTVNISPAATPTTVPTMGRQGDTVISEYRGKFGVANQNKSLFGFLVTGVTVPVVASGLVSVFTLYNPANSGVLAEITSVDVGTVLATTVVDVLGWYSSSAALTTLGTFTTKGVPLPSTSANWFSGRVQDTPTGQVIPYSAYTHSGTPVLSDIVGTWGAVTSTNEGSIHKAYDGELLLPPGIAMSLAMTTAASTSSGLSLGVHWIEVPFS